MKVVSIDVGIINLGMVCGEVTWENIIVEDVHLVDLTKHCRRRDCTLKHTNHMVDRIDHFIQGYKTILDKADQLQNPVHMQLSSGLQNVNKALLPVVPFGGIP